jgi:hypothetical protein
MRHLKNLWVRRVAYRFSGQLWFDRLELRLFSASRATKLPIPQKTGAKRGVSGIERAPELYFIHIPKNGGTSFSAMVEEFLPLVRLRRPWELRPQNINEQVGSDFGLTTVHMSPDSLVRAGLVSPAELTSWNSIAIVRDPLDRFVSLFKYHQLTHVISAETTISEYLDQVWKLHKSVSSLGHHSFHGLRQALPQTFWLKPKLWAGPKTVLRLEEISGDLSTLKDFFGPELKLKFQNVRPRSLDFQQNVAIEPSLRQTIMEIYSEDYEFIRWETQSAPLDRA